MSTIAKPVPATPMRFAWAVVFSTVLAVLVGLVPSLAPAAHASTVSHTDATNSPAGQPVGAVGIKIDSFSPTLITPGSDVSLKATITNTSATEITAPTANFHVMRYRFSTRTALARWQDQELGANAGSTIATIELGETLAPGATTTATFQVAADDLGLLAGTAGWGPRGVSVTVNGHDGAGTPQRVGALFTYLLWDSAPESMPAAIQVATVAAITGPGLNPLDSQAQAETLLTATAAQSRLERVTRSLRGAPQLTLAVDPQLLSGADAAANTTSAADSEEPVDPDQATPDFEPTHEQLASQAWLTDMTTLLEGAQAYALPDYDSDQGALVAAGLPLAVPTPSEVLGFAPQSFGTDLVWTEPDTLTQPFLTAAGTQLGNPIIVAQPGLEAPWYDLTYTPGAVVPNAAGGNLVMADPILTGLLTDPNTSDPIVARQRFISELAVLAKERPSEVRTIALTLPRNWNPTPEVAHAQLSSLSQLRWLTTHHLSDLVALSTPSSQAYTFPDQTDAKHLLSKQVIADVQAALKKVSVFARVVPEPTALTGSLTAAGQALSATAWRSNPTARTQLANEILEQSAAITGAITVDTGSDINLIATGSEIPLTVRNGLDQDVSVLVRLRPDNPRLQATTDVPVTITAGGSQQVRVPVTAVGSGDVTVTVQILTTEHRVAAESGSFTVRVRADWENLGTSVVIGLLAVILGIGVIRTIRRGKSKRRTGPNTPSVALEAVTIADAAGPGGALAEPEETTTP